MAAEKKKLEKWKGKLNKNNFLILVLLGALLLVAAWPVEKDKTVKSSQWDSESATIKETEKTEEETVADSALQSFAADYESRMEERLRILLSGMEGVGQVQVMITFEDTGEWIVEKDDQEKIGGSTEVDSAGGSRNTSDVAKQQETVFVNGETPFVRQRILPRAEGAVICAEGGGNPQTARKIKSAVQALFGIEPQKIVVEERKKNEKS